MARKRVGTERVCCFSFTLCIFMTFSMIYLFVTLNTSDPKETREKFDDPSAAVTIFHNAVFRTMAPTGPETAQALAVRGGRILAMGSHQGVKDSIAGSGAAVSSHVDLGGSYVVPGFVEVCRSCCDQCLALFSPTWCR